MEQVDSSMMIYTSSTTILILHIYIDDIIVFGNDPSLIQETIAKLNSTFSRKDLGDLNFILGISMTWKYDYFHLSQQKYIQ